MSKNPKRIKLDGVKRTGDREGVSESAYTYTLNSQKDVTTGSCSETTQDDDHLNFGGSTGPTHTVMWTDSGDMYTLGEGIDGKLGHGSLRDEYAPKMVEALKGKNVISASAGRFHTVALTKEGQVYTWGNNIEGQLGHGDDTDDDEVLLPIVLDIGLMVGEKVVGVSAGHFHTAVWTDNGHLYTFGCGWGGRLGHRALNWGWKNEYTPRLVEMLRHTKVVRAEAGGEHTLAWTDRKEMYVMGAGGVLGQK